MARHRRSRDTALSRPAEPELRAEFLLQLSVKLAPALLLPDAPLGARQILYAESGQFSGPGLQGAVLPGGGDWVLNRLLAVGVGRRTASGMVTDVFEIR